MKKKTIPLPVTEKQYKEIKMFCLINNLKYSDLSELLLKIIREQ